MRPYSAVILTLLLLCYSLITVAQKKQPNALLLKSGNYIPHENISQSYINAFSQGLKKFNGKAYCIIQFDHLLAENEKERLKQGGIVLLEYIPERSWVAEINQPL